MELCIHLEEWICAIKLRAPGTVGSSVICNGLPFVSGRCIRNTADVHRIGLSSCTIGTADIPYPRGTITVRHRDTTCGGQSRCSCHETSSQWDELEVDIHRGRIVRVDDEGREPYFGVIAPLSVCNFCCRSSCIYFVLRKTAIGWSYRYGDLVREKRKYYKKHQQYTQVFFNNIHIFFDHFKETLI